MCNTHHSLRLEQEAANASRALALGPVDPGPVDEDAAASAAPGRRTTDDELLATAGEARRDG